MELVGQCEGNNREDEVGVLCEGEVRGGSNNVRIMTCARDNECFGDNGHKEHCNVNLSHARENVARVNGCEVKRTVYTPRRLQKNRHFLRAKPLARIKNCNQWQSSYFEEVQDCDPVRADEEESEFDHVCQFQCRSGP